MSINVKKIYIRNEKLKKISIGHQNISELFLNLLKKQAYNIRCELIYNV